MNIFTQIALSIPLLIAALYWLIQAIRKPHDVTMLGLSYFAFFFQFILGIFLFPLNFQFEPLTTPGDILDVFVVIYLFWGTILLLRSLFRSPLDCYQKLYASGSTATGNGVFMNLAVLSEQVNFSVLFLVYAVTWFVRLYLFIRYDLGASGRFTEISVVVPYVWLSLWVIINPFGLVYCFVCFYRFLKGRRFVYLFFVVAEFLFLFMQGRRMLFIGLLLMLFAYLLWYGKMRIKYLVYAAAASVLLVYLIFPLFFYMRLEWLRGLSPAEAFVTAIRQTVSSREEYIYNVSQRLQAININYKVSRRINEGYPTTGGRFLKTAVIFNIPRLLYPQKVGIMWQPDEILDEQYGLEVQSMDTFSNFGLFALADYGLFGGIIYGIIFFLCIHVMEWMMRNLSRRGPLGFLVCFSVAASCPVMQMEWTLNDLFMILRTILILFIFMRVVYFFVGARPAAGELLTSGKEEGSLFYE